MTGSVMPDDWRGSKQIDLYDLKGAVEVVMSALNISGFTIHRASVEYLHPGQSAVLAHDGEEIARFGRLHPRVASLHKFRQPVFIRELEFERLLGLPADRVRYSAMSRFPAVSRDVSALVPDTVMWGDIEKAVRDLGKLKTWAQTVAATLAGLEAEGAWEVDVAWWALLVATLLTWVSGLDYARVAPRVLRGERAAS